MLTETAASTRQRIFRRKYNWEAYLGVASKTVPKLVIFGKEDAVNTFDFIDYIKEKWEPSLFNSVVLDDVGHTPFLEQPSAFNEILLKWASGL
jgi:pimeloyl-ACP methyl ester carboxylesterase